MSDEQRIILIADVLEQKLRKEKELEFYIKELEELQLKIAWYRNTALFTAPNIRKH